MRFRQTCHPKKRRVFPSARIFLTVLLKNMLSKILLAALATVAVVNAGHSNDPAADLITVTQPCQDDVDCEGTCNKRTSLCE